MTYSYASPYTIISSRLQAQAIGKPVLTISENITAYSSYTITVPIAFAGNGHQIAAVGFSIDYDETCLAFDDQDSVEFNLPRGLRPSLGIDTTDLDGELDIIIADYSPPFSVLPDDSIAFIEFTVICTIEPGESTKVIPVRFSLEPLASFGDTETNDVEGEAIDGSVLLLAGTPAAQDMTETVTETVTPTVLPSATMAPATVVPLPTTMQTPNLTPILTLSPSPPAIATRPPAQTSMPGATPTQVATIASDMTPVAMPTPIIPPTDVSTTNRPPIAVDDQSALNGKDVIQIDVLANDFDFDGDPLRIISFEQGAHGLVLLTDQGKLQYQPNVQPRLEPSSADIDIFHYTIFDRSSNGISGGSDRAKVIVSLNVANRLPNLQDDSLTTDEDTPIIIDVLTNDIDLDGDTLTVVDVSQGKHGTAAIQADGHILYTPDSDYYGRDNFVYYVDEHTDDPNSVHLAARVEVEVQPIPDAPIAVPDAVILRTASGNIATIHPLENDIDKDGAGLRITSITQPNNGIPTLLDEQTIRYVAPAGFRGVDQFMYRVDTAAQNTSITQSRAMNIEVEGTITVIVDPQADTVQAVDDFITTREDIPINFSVLNNDLNLATGATTDLVILGVHTHHGTMVVNNDSSLTYTPPTNASGQYTATYILGNKSQNQIVDADSGIIFMTVEPENDPPYAIIDRVRTDEEIDVVIDVLANDEDIDGDTLIITELTSAHSGLATLELSGKVRYTPDPNFYGKDTFTYKVADLQGAENSGLVYITVANINDAPVANQDMIMTIQNQPIDIIVLNNDFDVDGDTLTVSTITRAEHGGVLLSHNHMLTYVPNENYVGGDSFQYTIDDGQISANSQVYVTILQVDSALSQTPTVLFGEEPFSIQLFLPFIQK